MCTSGGSTLCCIIRGKDIDHFINRYIDLNPVEFDSPEYRDRKVAREDMKMWLDTNEDFICSWNSNDKDGKRFTAQIMNDDPYYPNVYFMPIARGLEYQTVDLPLICVPADKGSFAKAIFSGNFYKSREELLMEMRNKLGQYLPDSFDWEASIGDLDYALFA